MARFPVTGEISADAEALLARLGIAEDRLTGTREAVTPLTGEVIARVADMDAPAVQDAIGRAHSAFLEWRLVPAPRRGELVRLFDLSVPGIFSYHLACRSQDVRTQYADQIAWIVGEMRALR